MTRKELQSLLLSSQSKADVAQIAKKAAAGEVDVNDLIYFSQCDEHKLRARSAWIMRDTHDLNPRYFQAHVKTLLEHVRTPNIHTGEIRNLLIILADLPLNDDQLEELLDPVLQFLGDNRYPVAVKANSMPILERIAQKWPEIAQEIIICIEDQLPYGSAGFKNRGSKTVLRLKHLQKRAGII